MPSLETALSGARDFWTERPLAHRILIGGTLLSLSVIFLLVVYWLNRADYKVLYSRLYPEDAAAVVEMLQKEKVAYRLADNGSTILVPSSKVYDLRLAIAGKGALHGQGIGYEIFDESKIGQTDFVQHINYQRALQGELARTMGELPGVERARVHLVMPSRSLFIEEQNLPSASVMLKVTPGQELTSRQIQSIVNLVSTSVEGLTRDRITVADTSGRVLYEPRGEESLEGLSSVQLEHKAGVERRLQQAIEQMLVPVLGSGKVIARVNADLDFSRRTIRKEFYDPDSAVVRSEQKSDEETLGSMQTEAGVPEAAFAGTAGSGAGSTQSATRTSSTTNFEINKEEQSIIAPVGRLERLSVAVIVDGTYQQDDAGSSVFVPRSDEELRRIRELVQRAVGFDSARGDAIEVTSFAFDVEQFPVGESTFAEDLLYYVRLLAKPLLNSILVLLFLLMVVRPLVLALIRPRVSGEIRPGEGSGLPEGERRMALGGGSEGMEGAASMRRLENIKEMARDTAQKNTDQAVALVKSWLREGQAR
jgi:flagellar M-ring protein FliF